MTPARVYYVNYIDPATGFLKREETTGHRALTDRIAELKKAGVVHVTVGSYETP